MEVINNKTENPIKIYQDIFREKDPLVMKQKTGLEYIEENQEGFFVIPFLNRSVGLHWPSMETYYIDSEQLFSLKNIRSEERKTADYTRILLARFAMEGALVPSSGKFLAYSEMPWGPVYETQFRGRCISRLAGMYGKNLKGFEEGCEAIGGIKDKGADSAYVLELLPGFFIKVFLWEGDEEFRATAQVLFSDNFPLAFTAEDIAVVGDIFINAMRNRW